MRLWRCGGAQACGRPGGSGVAEQSAECVPLEERRSRGTPQGKRGGGPALLSSVPWSRATPAPPRRGGGGWWEGVQGSSTETLISANLQS